MRSLLNTKVVYLNFELTAENNVNQLINNVKLVSTIAQKLALSFYHTDILPSMLEVAINTSYQITVAYGMWRESDES